MRNEYANCVRVFLHIITVLPNRVFLYISTYRYSERNTQTSAFRYGESQVTRRNVLVS